MTLCTHPEKLDMYNSACQGTSLLYVDHVSDNLQTSQLWNVYYVRCNLLLYYSLEKKLLSEMEKDQKIIDGANDQSLFWSSLKKSLPINLMSYSHDWGF